MKFLDKDGLTHFYTKIKNTFATKSDLLACYPVGTIYITMNNVNPSSTMGGTWSKLTTAGYFLLNSGNYIQEYYDSDGKTIKNYSVTWNRTGVNGQSGTCQHTHDYTHSHSAGASHAHTYTYSSAGDHVHKWNTHNNIAIDNGSGAWGLLDYNGSGTGYGTNDSYTDTDSKTHSHTVPALGTKSLTTGNSSALTTGNAFSGDGGNLPPYFNCAMWRRTE